MLVKKLVSISGSLGPTQRDIHFVSIHSNFFPVSGLMEDLEDMRMEAEEKKRKKKRRKLSDSD